MEIETTAEEGLLYAFICVPVPRWSLVFRVVNQFSDIVSRASTQGNLGGFVEPGLLPLPTSWRGGLSLDSGLSLPSRPLAVWEHMLLQLCASGVVLLPAIP